MTVKENYENQFPDDEGAQKKKRPPIVVDF